jgi:hypothetical protein
MPVVPAVVTRDSDDYAALRPNLIGSRASTVGTLRAVSMAKLTRFAALARLFYVGMFEPLREAHFLPTRRNVVPI